MPIETTFRNAARKHAVSAFTLAELIVVITILAILSTIGFLALSGYREDARDAVTATNVRSVYSAISNESAATGNSPRYYVVHDDAYALSWGVVVFDGIPVPLVWGAWNAAGTNYSAGNPDYAKLKLEREKFKVAFLNPYGRTAVTEKVSASWTWTADPTYLIVGTTDVVDPSGSGKRIRSFMQVAALKPSGGATVSGDFPTAVPGSAGGLVRDVSSESSTWALIDGMPAWTPAYCEAATASGYSVPELTSGQTAQVTKTASHGTLSAKALCAFWRIAISEEFASCESWYVPVSGAEWPSCSVDSCGGQTPGTEIPHAESNATSQSLSATWHYSTTPGQCSFACSTGYSWNGTSCKADCQTPLTAEKSWLQYTLASLETVAHSWTLYLTWTHAFWTSPANGTLSATFQFSCDDGTLSANSTNGSGSCQTNFAWNASWTAPSCSANSQSGSCSWLPANASWNTATNVLQTWNGTAWTPTLSGAYNETPSASECRFKCQNGHAWDESTSTCKIAYVQVSSWTNFSCALNSEGAVKCWGVNTYGQLGNGTTTNSHIPVQVTWLTSWVEKISVGNSHACALMTGGTVKCWGYNPYGGLWDGTTTDRSVPVNVSWLTWVSKISAGTYYSCALMTGGAVKCWGYNPYGGLWDGTTTNSPIPVSVSGISWATELSAWQYSACAIESGGLKCWGYNVNGQLGNWTTANSPTPVQVNGLTAWVTKVSVGVYHACAVVSGVVKCWWLNSYGGIWDGTKNTSNVPVQVTGMADWAVDVSLWNAFACALNTNQSLKCWGRNFQWQLGDWTKTDKLTPVQFSWWITGITSYSTGNQNTCVIVSWKVRCNGGNPLWNVWVPQPFVWYSPTSAWGWLGWISQVATGNPFTCALSSWSVSCSGQNTVWEIWDGTQENVRLVPTAVSWLSSWVTQISGWSNFACAVVWWAAKCWWHNIYGKLGIGSSDVNNPVPTQVVGLASWVTQVKAGVQHACAIVSGAVKCWGYNPWGELWDGTTTSTSTPVTASWLTSGVTQIATWQYSSCAIVSGAVKCWGYNGYGWLGDGSTTMRTSPTQVSGLTSGVTGISVGVYHACAVVSGAAKCWGYNVYGQLWNGTTANSPTPVQVSGLTSGVTQIAVGQYSACALMTWWNVKCWGWNNTGKLGIWSTENATYKTSPEDIPGISWATQIDVASSHACALVAWEMKCWGWNGWNQFWNGEDFLFPTLQPIPL